MSIWGGGITHVVRLLQHPEVATIEPAQITSIGVGGSATPPDVTRQIEERFPHLAGAISSGYGSTETGLISWAPGWMLKAAPDCVGPLMPTMDARITDDDGTGAGRRAPRATSRRAAGCRCWATGATTRPTPRPCGPGAGSAPATSAGSTTASCSSRRAERDLIIRGGENIYPFEIEHRLDEHPDIVEATVFGIDDPVHGQEVKAVVVVRPGTALTADEVRAFCAESLASYKVPATVEIRTDPLPRTATGKVMKQVVAGDAESTFVEE